MKRAMVENLWMLEDDCNCGFYVILKNKFYLCLKFSILPLGFIVVFLPAFAQNHSLQIEIRY